MSKIKQIARENLIAIGLYKHRFFEYTYSMRHVIIGNGIAGTTAAQNIRRFDATGEITIITEEDTPFYSRMRLPEYLAGEVDESKLILYKNTWYEENKIKLITNKKVLALEPTGKQIVLDGDVRIPYDKLLVATGSRASVPSVRGVDKKGVFTLRTIADARKIKAYAETVTNAMILGGGVLGLEVGSALKKSGKAVTIIEFYSRLLPRQMDVEGSRIFQETLEKMGLSVVLDAKAEEVLGSDLVQGLKLQDGRVINGQMLAVSAGIIPDVSLFKSTGITLNKGVPVNDRMETELPDVYAAGDVAEHKGRMYGIWPAAEKQGETAGVNMAGGSAVYTGTTMSNYIKVAGIEVLSMGELDLDNKLSSLVFQDKEKSIYRKIITKDNSVAGCILCGDMTGKKEISSAVQEKRPVTDMRETFEKLDLSWMPSPK